MILQKQYHIDALNVILSPSWLSGLLAVIAGLIVTGGVILAFTANNSQVQQQILVWQKTTTPSSEPALTTPDEVLQENDKPTIQGSWPLLIFWSALGLVVYVIAMFITKSIKDAEAFRESLDYVHADKHVMLQGAAIHIALRLAIIGLWILFTVMFIKLIIPYCITTAHASAGDIISPHGIAYALASFLVIVLSVHLHAVFMRLTFGKARVLSNINEL